MLSMPDKRSAIGTLPDGDINVLSGLQGINRKLQPFTVTNDAYRQSFDSEVLLTQVDNDGFKFAIFWQEFNLVALFFRRLTVTSSSIRATTT